MALDLARTDPGKGGDNGTSPSVAVVITTCNDFAFLISALRSVVRQRCPPTEILLVDDGSEHSPAPLLKNFPQVKLLRKPNGGPSSARNVGLNHASARFITFLDADDLYEPGALRDGLRCFSAHPEATMVYGAHRRIWSDGWPITGRLYQPPGPDPYASLLRANIIGMHATVLYRRDALLAAGGFDETSQLCEDWDLYLRLAKHKTIASHDAVVAEYRWHGDNVSKQEDRMLRAALEVHGRHSGQTGERLKAWREGQAAIEKWYGGEQRSAWGTGRPKGIRSELRRKARSILTTAKERWFTPRSRSG